MTPFEKYLTENNIKPQSKEERKELHTAFRTIYQREYRKRKERKKKKRVEIHFDPASFITLEEKAREHSLSVPSFIRATIESYNDQAYILRDKEAMKAIEIVLRQCASSLTQIAFEARRSNSVRLSELGKLQAEIKALRDKVSKALALPATAKQFLLSQQEINPQFLTRLKSVLDNLLEEKQ